MALVVLSDDRLASGSIDETIRIWNATTGECEATLTGHEGPVTALVVLSDDRLASGSYDETVRIWNLTTGESKRYSLSYPDCFPIFCIRYCETCDTEAEEWIRTYLCNNLYLETEVSASAYANGYVVFGGTNGNMFIVDIRGSILCPSVDIVSTDTLSEGCYGKYVSYGFCLTPSFTKEMQNNCIHRRYSDVVHFDQRLRERKNLTVSIPKLPREASLTIFSSAASVDAVVAEQTEVLQKYLQALVALGSPQLEEEIRRFLREISPRTEQYCSIAAIVNYDDWFNLFIRLLLATYWLLCFLISLWRFRIFL